MTPAQRRRVRDLFESLVDADPADVPRRLAAECGDDPQVHAEVLSLLQHHSAAGGFLETTPLVLADPGALPSGTVLGAYTIVREVGRGGMGRVYLAMDARLQRQVCLKAVRGDVAASGYRERLRREARTVASLSHPNICAVYALEEFAGQPYLVTEYIEGRTLREEMDAGVRPSASGLIETLTALASAMAAAHARGITHSDLKPENIMRAADGRVKVLDFGVARVQQGPDAVSATSMVAGALVGTPEYMAPEQLNGEVLDARADVFALGVLAYELATGVHPFAAPTVLATAARILGARPEPLRARRPDLPDALVEIVERCLAKRPGDRPESAAIASAMNRIDRRGGAGEIRRWWRVHQFAIVGLYVVAAVLAWRIQRWEPSFAARWMFLLLGVLAAISGVTRGHLLFTDRAHPQRLPAERQRTRIASLACDVGIAGLLLTGAGIIAPSRPVISVLVMGLAAGIATSAVLIEPSTSRGALDVP